MKRLLLELAAAATLAGVYTGQRRAGLMGGDRGSRRTSRSSRRRHRPGLLGWRSLLAPPALAG